jgi:hypothetical protein
LKNVKEAGDKFHQNFQAGYRAHPLRYKCVNLCISRPTQSKTKVRAKAKMLAKGHVPARLQQPSID